MSSMLRVLKKIALGGCLLASPVLTSGQNAFSPGGSDYAIVGALAGDQTSPHAVINANGGYLVWQDNAVTTSGNRIRAARLDGNLQANGNSFVVSTDAQRAGNRENPQVSLLNGGGAVVVWQDGRVGFQKVYARFLNASGGFLTSEIRVNTYTNEFQINPAVAALTDGSVVVIWASFGQDASYQGIFGQRFTATGDKLGSEFQLNQFTANNQRTPAIAALAGGGFVAVWISELQRASGSVDVYARIFDASGVAVGNEFPANLSSTNVCANPAVAGAPQGGFSVVWSQNDNLLRAVGNTNPGFQPTQRSEKSWDVFARLFSSNGTPSGAPVRVNTRVYGDQYGPKVSAFGADYLVVWTSLGQDHSWEGVFGQFLTSEGALSGVEFQINTATISRQVDPTVSSDGANRFLVGWSSFQAGTSFDLFARVYDLIRVEMTSTTQGLVLKWNTQPGWFYQVWVSDDGVTWRTLGSQRKADRLSDAVNLGAANGVAYYRVIRVAN